MMSRLKLQERSFASSSLTFISILFLLFFIAINIGEYVASRTYMNFESASAHQINISGRQKMLSQRSFALMLLIKNEKNYAYRQKLLTDLVDFIELFEQNHDKLSHVLPSTAVKKAFISVPLALNEKVSAYIAKVHTFILSEKNRQNAQPSSTTISSEDWQSNTILLNAIDNLVSQYEQQNSSYSNASRHQRCKQAFTAQDHSLQSLPPIDHVKNGDCNRCDYKQSRGV